MVARRMPKDSAGKPDNVPAPIATSKPAGSKPTGNGHTRLTPEEQALLVSGHWPMISEGDKKIVAEYAKMPELAKARTRQTIAKSLGIGVGDLKSVVKSFEEERATADVGHAAEFPHWVIKGWPEEVDGDALLRDIIARIKRHNVITDAQALTVTLWAVMAWAHAGAVVHSPVLLITSPEFGSGKTQLLSLLSFLAPRGYHMVDPNPSRCLSDRRRRPTNLMHR